MYPNLRAEIARRNMSLEQVAAIIDRTMPSTSRKLSGKNDFTLKECKKLSVVFGLPIEELFEVRNG